MTATFSSIQTRVQARLIDVPAPVVAEIPQLINDAYKRLQKRHKFKVMEQLLTATTVFNTRNLVAMPAGWICWRDKPWYTNNDGTEMPMQWATSHWSLLGGFGTQDIGYPQFTHVPEVTSDSAGNIVAQIEVWPLPDGGSDYSDGQYRITIPWFGYLPALSGANDTNWLVDRGELALVYDAVSHGFPVNWDESRAAYWASLAEPEIQRVIKEDKLMRLSGFKELFPSRDAYPPHVGA